MQCWEWVTVINDVAGADYPRRRTLINLRYVASLSERRDGRTDLTWFSGPVEQIEEPINHLLRTLHTTHTVDVCLIKE